MLPVQNRTAEIQSYLVIIVEDSPAKDTDIFSGGVRDQKIFKRRVNIGSAFNR